MTDRLAVKLGPLTLQNPVMPASGTFGFGLEMAKVYDLNVLGALCLKGTTLEARFGNPTPRIAECEAGLLNAIGLQNPGARAVVEQELPRLRELYSGPVIANISGFSVEEYVETARIFDEHSDAAILEINVSCPNVRHGGMAFGTDPAAAAQVTAAVKRAVKKPVFLKLSPNVTDIAAIAAACEDAGADGLTLINTLLGLRIDPRTGRRLVSTGAAGFSGPAIKPVAVRMVWQAAQRVKIPIIGAGGLSTADDVLEMLRAGASAVQIGAQNLVQPTVCRDLIQALPALLDSYHIDRISDIIGGNHP